MSQQSAVDFPGERRLHVALVLCIVISLTVLWVDDRGALGCVVCFRPSQQSLLEKVEAGDRAVVARLVDQTHFTWQIVDVFKGGGIQVNQTIVVNASLPNSFDQRNVGLRLVRWNALGNNWTVEDAMGTDIRRFLKGAISYSADESTRLNTINQEHRLLYFLNYLEHADLLIADSAYAKLAGATYADLRKLRPHLVPHRLLTSIGEGKIAAQRQSLYITMLGICGQKREETLLKNWIDQKWRIGESSNLGASLTAYLELNGEDAVRFIEQSYIKDRDRTLSEITEAIDALRVHGETDRAVSRTRVMTSYRRFLNERPQLVELITQDCTRWKDWSLTDQFVNILESRQYPWTRKAIIDYLKSCPLPEATSFVGNSQ